LVVLLKIYRQTLLDSRQMLHALSNTFGEGVSALLVIGVMLAFFTRAGREPFRRAIRRGIALSIPVTAVAATRYSIAANQALWEGVLSLAAAVSVAWIAWFMWRVTRLPHTVSGRPITSAVLCVTTVLLIARGGIEIALLVGAVVLHVPTLELIVGAVLGPVVAIGLGVVWAYGGHRMPQRLFGQVTAIFLVMLFVRLLADGVHEITATNVVAGAAAWHQATESFSSDGLVGRYLTLLLVVAPVAWWLVAIFWGHGKASGGRVAHMGR
jgi:high-affinity iron transporter